MTEAGEGSTSIVNKTHALAMAEAIHLKTSRFGAKGIGSQLGTYLECPGTLKPVTN